jgi:hypothetical protein
MASALAHNRQFDERTAVCAETLISNVHPGLGFANRE